MGCCQSHLLSSLQHSNDAYLEADPSGTLSRNPTEFVHAVLSGIQENHRKLKVKRLEKHSSFASGKKHPEYISDILADLEKEEKSSAETIRVLIAQLGTPAFDENKIKDDIRSYIEQRRISKSEVQAWIKEKTRVVKRNGKQIISQVSSFHFDQTQKERCWQVLQVMIDDQLDNPKDFLLSIAYDFLWREELDRPSLQWQASLKTLYPSLDLLVQ